MVNININTNDKILFIKKGADHGTEKATDTVSSN